MTLIKLSLKERWDLFFLWLGYILLFPFALYNYWRGERRSVYRKRFLVPHWNSPTDWEDVTDERKKERNRQGHPKVKSEDIVCWGKFEDFVFVCETPTLFRLQGKYLKDCNTTVNSNYINGMLMAGSRIYRKRNRRINEGIKTC